MRIVLIIVYTRFMIVCVCNRLTEHDVREAARSGARTPEAAYEKLGCEVQCGCCLYYAQDVIDEELATTLDKRAPLRLVA